MGRAEIIKSLEDAGLRPNKRYGQNFCCDPQLLEAIVRDAGLAEDELVVEVGAGTGALTRLLCEGAGRVLSFEIDAGLYRFTRRALGQRANLRLVHGDVLAGKNHLAPAFLEAIASELGAERPRARLVANLPYAITTPLLLGLFESELPIAGATALVQREAAERLLAPPGSKRYGAASVILSHLAAGRILRPVSAEVFYPRPKVASVVLELAARRGELAAEWRPLGQAYERFRVMVRRLFQSRRKTIAAAARIAAKAEEALSGLDGAVADGTVDGRARVENLTLEDLRGLAADLVQREAAGET